MNAFDLSQVRQAADLPSFRALPPKCDPAASATGEIVVCAPDPESERLRPLKGDYKADDGLPRAELDLGDGVSTGVDLQAARLPDGTVSNRVMAHVKIKF